jgi:hypothetical protein
MTTSKKIVTPADPGSRPGGVQVVCNRLKTLVPAYAGMTRQLIARLFYDVIKHFSIRNSLFAIHHS